MNIKSGEFMNNRNSKWHYIDEIGTFLWNNPHTHNQLYFPLCNEAGMMSSITPSLNGDAKTGQHTFLLQPVSVEDLHNNRSARNFWIFNEDFGANSLTGNSSAQISQQFENENNIETFIKGTFLSHHLARIDNDKKIKSEIISFCPETDDTVELMWVKITNISDKSIIITPTTAIPLYGRSADNIRDHKHATSLMHRMELNEYGVSITPTMHHDENGHRPNNHTYFALATGGNGEKPIGQFPTVSEFIGEYGKYDWPLSVVKNLRPYKNPPNRRDGMEAIGAIRFNEVSISPGETLEYIVISGVTENKERIPGLLERYGSSRKIEKALENNFAFWKKKVERITFTSNDNNFDKWMRWVGLQPNLRKIYGCSFLPHHDYGKGGRGWRDLWQDCLALLLQNPDELRELLIANFAGIRLDGSNATIINKGSGNFSADRNKISRVWMDHGVWPYFTIKLYIDQTGDIDILLEEISYWKDYQIQRAKATDHNWNPELGNCQKTDTGEIYKGNLLEHMLIQHLTCFHNVGDHNNIKLEDADWNDQLDMAPQKGESVPFSAFYGWNLLSMSQMLLKYRELTNSDSILLSKELLILTGLNGRIDNNSVTEKRERLISYFNAVDYSFSGEKIEVNVEILSQDLKEKGQWILNHISKNEWIESKSGHAFFNGYYNNDGNRVDGDQLDDVTMNLTAQTFPIMSGAATDVQVRKAYESSGTILKDPATGGYRLTTPLGPNTWNFGRGFALVYGEKETGGMFSHMAVMFMNALYRRGFVKEGYEVLSTIYRLCNDTAKAKIYPGIPEYITHEGRGMYHYLTGSASWLIMTVITEIFGIRGDLGDLLICPRLVKDQFNKYGEAGISTTFASREIQVLYHNPQKLDYNRYKITGLKLNENDIEFQTIDEKSILVQRVELETLRFNGKNKIDVILG